jgi:ABC-type polar amino acid transport system ATPase subunit
MIASIINACMEKGKVYFKLPQIPVVYNDGFMLYTFFTGAIDREENTMIINQIVLSDFRMFKYGFVADFCSGVNIFIGRNATGKTSLLKIIYEHKKNEGRTVFIPEKDILEHAKGLLTFIEQKQTGFGTIYRDVLINAQDVPTQHQSETQKSSMAASAEIINGEVQWDKGDGTYYTLRKDGTRIPFDNEASGYKKLGFIGLLVASGQLESGSVLLWDEPENSLNREIVPELVNLLLELAHNGVQIFLATHDYNLARYFDVRQNKDIPVLFHHLRTENDGKVICESSPEYMEITDNHMEKASEDLFKAVVADAMGIQANG